MSDELPEGLIFAQPVKRGRPPDGPHGMNKAARRKKKKDDKAKEEADLKRPPQSTKTEYKGPATPRSEQKKGIFEGEKRAVDVAFHWSDVEPAEEKQWVIDQMLRSMLGGLGYRDFREQYQKEWNQEWDQGSEPEWENEEEYDEPNDKQQEYDADSQPEDSPEDEDNDDEDSGSDSNGESDENTSAPL